MGVKKINKLVNNYQAIKQLDNYEAISLPKGLSADVIKKISKIKHEPK
jgi:hypothetical protein